MQFHRLIAHCSLAAVVSTLSLAEAASAAPRRIVPEKGVAVPSAKREELTRDLAKLKRQIYALRVSFRSQPRPAALIPDVEIYHKAVQSALEQDLFFAKGDIAAAEILLNKGFERAGQLRVGEAPWTTAAGLVVRGYVSKIDGSVQPYGLVVPQSFDPAGAAKHRLDVWHHGRNNKLSELRFISERQTKVGQFAPKGAFVLHPYGRYCNAMKFAGETDTFEALEHAKRHYRIDENRITVRGFSMGGAATWHMATHHADIWAAASPGAGFAETAVYQDIFNKKPKPTWWEQKLWRLYDATQYAGNLHQCPTIAYSGEIDKQKQAADIMAGYMKKEGLELEHIIGPGMGHKFHPDSKIEVEKRLAELLEKGRNPIPKKIRFTTFTLRYNRMRWVQIDNLKQHWERARVNADILDKYTIQIQTENVTGLTLDMGAGLCPLDRSQSPKVIIDGQELLAPGVPADRSWIVHFIKPNDKWTPVAAINKGTVNKVHGLQGPIDDAFLDSFLMVSPTGKPIAGKPVTDWIAGEMRDAGYQWAMQFRGRPRTKPDTDVTEDDIKNHNLILWGDPGSNAILKRIADKLPIRWRADQIVVGDTTYTADKQVPVLIYPNPLNPKRYVVINSGFTFALNGSASNSTQVPKLPDWAVIDITVPAEKRIPAGVVDCDFFGESWQLVKSKERK
jgi:hypothetical protein